MLYPTAGSRLFIADAPTTRDGVIPAGGWVEIGETEALGLLGIEWVTTEVDTAHLEIGSLETVGEICTSKVSRRGVPMQIVMGNDPADPGQIILWGAAKSQAHFPFRLDLPNGGPSRTWLALVISLAEAFDTANGVIRLQADLVVSPTKGIERSEAT